MLDIEEFVRRFEELPAAKPPNWRIATLVPKRLHITRGPAGQYAVFVEGDKASFGKLPALAGLDHRTDVHAIPAGSIIAALKLEASDEPYSIRAVAHIAYELTRRLEENPNVANASLLGEVAWVLQLLGERAGAMELDRQKGLGECLLLRQLLATSRKPPPPGEAHNTSNTDRPERAGGPTAERTAGGNHYASSGIPSMARSRVTRRARATGILAG